MPNVQELEQLIERAKAAQTSMSDCSDLLGNYIKEAEDILFEMKEQELSPSQREIFKRLEDAVGPGLNDISFFAPNGAFFLSGK